MQRFYLLLDKPNKVKSLFFNLLNKAIQDLYLISDMSLDTAKN